MGTASEDTNVPKANHIMAVVVKIWAYLCLGLKMLALSGDRGSPMWSHFYALFRFGPLCPFKAYYFPRMPCSLLQELKEEKKLISNYRELEDNMGKYETKPMLRRS